MAKQRQSNIELYRIIVMLSIVAHHYVVNSGVWAQIGDLSLFKRLFMFSFGAWGKVGINSFVLITGYFMCKQNISFKKWFALFGEVAFYNIVIYIIAVIFFGGG